MDLTLHASKEREQIPMIHAVRQYLAVPFLVIGLIAAGCGDTASVNPDATLASLTVDPGSLEPAFSGGTTQYNVNLSSSITSVTITAQPAVSGDTVTINGQNTTSSVITLGAAGTTTPVNIVVSGSGANPGGYTVLLIRAGLTGNNSLQSLSVSPGTLAPTFEENFQSYTVDVANNVGSITVTPTLSDTAATMTVNGQATNSGQSRTITLNPAGQDTAIPIVVTAQNSSVKTYSVTVSRGVSSNNNLQSLTISPGTLNQTFNANRTSYVVNVASTVTSVTVTPRLQDATARMTVNGQATNSGQARTHQLGAPGPTSPPPIFIVVTAQNGTQKTYTVGVNRAALGGNNNLSGLTVSPGSLSPAFTAARTSYTVNVGSGVDSITVTATKADSNADMTINGQGTNSGQARSINLGAPGSSTEIDITVTAPNGNSKTYTTNVERASPSSNNNLSALSVTPGSLSPAFAADTLGYTVNVASDVTSVAISATKANSNAVISGDVPNSGQANITLSGPGTTTSVSIIVTAPSGTSKTYTIDIIRAAPSAPPAPASAPDLIPQDDSGFLPGQDADNITNVNTPRFRVPSPGAGETPNLYVDGSKVDATFDQGANTLKPTTALNDGAHSITSTVTNAGGESSPSPPLPVTIDTIAPGLP